MSLKTTNQKGFTLIELVIVLAIAALILAGVLLAVSGAQKSRRDTQRKNDLSNVAATLESYASNKQGAYPTNQNIFNGDFGTGGTYNNVNWKDPLTGNPYTFNGLVTPSGSTSAGISYTKSGRTFTVCIGLEVGPKFCQTNK